MMVQGPEQCIVRRYGNVPGKAAHYLLITRP